MRNSYVPVLLSLTVATLAACGSAGPESSSAPTEGSASTSASTTMAPVVQPKPLTLVPLGVGTPVAGESRTITVEPVVRGTAVDLQPVTQ
jgi:uncharacterized lipoprotein